MTTLAELGSEQYVSLTTFRRSGEPVATAVWVASDGSDKNALVVTTAASTGKVKRIRHTPTVTLRPCSRTGQVASGAEETRAHAEIVDDPAEIRALSLPIARKYGLLARALFLTDHLSRRRQRVVLRLTAPTS